MTTSSASFDHIAEHFDRFAELVGGPLDEFIDSQLPEAGGQRAVDLGCGTGRHAALLAARYRHVLAVDISVPMLDLAMARRGLANIDYQQRDLRSVGADTDGAFDLVLSAYALHHLADHDLEQALRGIRELAAPGGRVILIDNVAATRQVSRRWFWGEAIRILAGDLIRRRRHSEEAWELLRLNVDPGWLDHLTSDRFLSPNKFADRYGQVFPGASFTDLYRARALSWARPISAPTSQPQGGRSASTPPGKPAIGDPAAGRERAAPPPQAAARLAAPSNPSPPGASVNSHQPPPGPPADIDTTTANPARIYDALLRGKDHYPVDRAAAQAILDIAPQARQGAKENRAFLQRAVRYLAQQGIRQFLDIGTGLPTQGNVHEVARQVTPDARVAYVDYDSVVHVHANALLANNSPTTLAVLGDLREPEAILAHPQVRRLLDFSRPVGVLLVAVLHFIRDEEDPVGIVARLRDAMAPGSYLVVSHATGDFHPQVGAEITKVYERASAPLVLRSHSQIRRFFKGFDLVEPGLVQPGAWRPDPKAPTEPSSGGFYSGVGRRRGGTDRRG